MRQIKSFFFIILLLGIVMLTGCATPKRDDASYAATTPIKRQPVTINNGSIYQANTALRLFEDLSARRVGDILTVNLEERTQAEKKADTNLDKKTDLSMLTPTIMGQAVTLNGLPLSNSLNSAYGMAGASDTSQSNKLSGNVTVTVAEVLANGNLVIQGEKWITLNQGDEYVRLRGIVRPVDIAPDNTISSIKVANAQIYYSGKGALADANKPGWITRFFLSPWAPY